MIKAKSHFERIDRSPPDKFDRTQYLRLDKNENTLPLPDPILNCIKDRITPDLVSTYPQIYPLYEKLSRTLGLNEEFLLLTSGSDAAIKNVFEVFISPGDEVIIPDPTYAMYGVYANLFEARPVTIPFGADLTFSMKHVRNAINDRTKLIALANPNSPTGCVIDQTEILELVAYAETKDILVLIDEAYYPYYPETVLDFVKTYTNLLVTRTFSKAYGLAALRLGFAAANPGLIRDLTKFRPIYEVNGLAVLFGCILLDNPEIVSRNVNEVLRGREILVQEMASLGFSSFPSHTNFLNIKVGEDLVVPLSDFLKTRNVLIKHGHDHPALKGCIRITVGCEEQMFIVTRLVREFLMNRPALK